MKPIAIALATALVACTAESAPAVTALEPDGGVSIATDAGTDEEQDPSPDADVETPTSETDAGVETPTPSEPATCTPRTCEDLMYECGNPDNGCGAPLDCGYCADAIACTDGQCVCPPDIYETSTEALRGTLVDVDDSVVFTQGRISESSDTDEYLFEVIDSGIGGNPFVTITMTQGLAGVKIDSVRYLCASGGDETSVNITDSKVELTTECAGPEEDGTLYVTVTKNATTTEECMPYEFRVTANE